MTSAPDISCPECGAANHGGAHLCRQCGAALDTHYARKPRVQRKLLRRTDFVSAARANRAGTTRLIIILLLVGTALGYLIGWSWDLSMNRLPGTPLWYYSEPGVWGAAAMFGVSFIWTLIAMKLGDKIVMRMTGAHLADPQTERQLHNVVEEMSIAAGVPKPAVYIVETQALNAFATGMSPTRAAVAVTRGLLDALSRDELQGVIGHELGHVVNWDIRYATAVSVMVGLVALVSDFVLRGFYYRGRRGSRDGAGVAGVFLIVFAILAPIFAKLVQFAISRQREFLADATSVRLTRNPQGMISALEKLASQAEPFKGANRATQHMFIVNPFRNFGEKASSLLATHPPIERRIQRLRNLGSKDYE